jgi:hypothetical protein
MPGTPIAEAAAAPNSQNPTSSAQPRVKHRQMIYTGIHCRSIFAEFQNSIISNSSRLEHFTDLSGNNCIQF